jgi:hypothetical protein
MLHTDTHKQSFQPHNPWLLFIIGLSETPPLDFFFSTNLLYVLKTSQSRESICALRARKPPHSAPSSGGNTSLSLKPVVRNLLELISKSTGGRDRKRVPR